MVPSSLKRVTPLRRITGANIPEDLFETILDFLDEEIELAMTRFDYGEKEKKNKKRELGRCSLTCRYWARRCQPRIFEHIYLRSKRDLEQLLSLLESPSSHISGYIKRLYLTQKSSHFKSWVYLVSLQLVPKFSLIPTINLHFDGPWEETHTKQFGHLRSIHYMLPSARPEFSSHISHLTLYRLRFRCFEDLAHLVGELRALRRLKCTFVRWSSPMPENYVIPVCPPSLDSVAIYGCTDDAIGVLFLMGRRRRMLRDEAILPFCLDRHQPLRAAPFIYNSVRALCGITIFRYAIEKVGGVYHIDCRWFFDTYLTFLFTPTTNSKRSEVHLETIVINLSYSRPMNAAMKWDWKKSDTLASRLPDLQKVVFGFESRKDMSRFVNEVVDTQMENLRGAGKLSYAVLDRHKTERWMRASPGSDKLESSLSESEDHEVVNTENLRDGNGELEYAMFITSDSDDSDSDYIDDSDSDNIRDCYKYELTPFERDELWRVYQ